MSTNEKKCDNCKNNKLCKSCFRINNPLTCKNLEKRGCRNISNELNTICDICKDKQKQLNIKYREQDKKLKEENIDPNSICKYCNKTLKKINKSGDNSHNECYKKYCDENNIIICNGWEHFGCRIILDNNNKKWCDECYNKKNGYIMKCKELRKRTNKCEKCCRSKFRNENLCLECIKNNNIKICSNILRNSSCIIYLDDDDNKWCKKCKHDENTYGKMRIDKFKENKLLDTNICTSCGIKCEEFEFIGHFGKITTTCSMCRYVNKRADEKRKYDEKRKEYKQKYEKKEEVIETRKKWKQNNYEKVTKYWIEYRGKMIKSDLNNYLKRNAEFMKKYRENNKEKFEEINKQNKLNDNYKLQYYKYRATHQLIEYNIDDNMMINMFHDNCIYCGLLNENELNGIDRLDNDIGYIEDNVVPCCKTCNYMKRCIDSYIFIKKCEHILTYNKIIDGEINYNLFNDHTYIRIEDYNRRANKKMIEIELTKEEFNKITKNDCYICGKISSDKHKNGIDRYDNNKGYYLDNCKPCCSDCNYMKRDIDYDTFIKKLIEIYENTNKNINKLETKYDSNIFLLNDTFYKTESSNIDNYKLFQINNNENELNDKNELNNDKLNENELDNENKNEIINEMNNNKINDNEISDNEDNNSIDTENEINIVDAVNNNKKIINYNLNKLYIQKKLYEEDFDKLTIFKNECILLSNNNITDINKLEEQIKSNTTIYERIRKNKQENELLINEIKIKLIQDKKELKMLKQKENILLNKDEYKILLLLKLNIKIQILNLENKKIDILNNDDHEEYEEIKLGIIHLKNKYNEINNEIYNFLKKKENKNIINPERIILKLYKNKIKEENKINKINEKKELRIKVGQ